MRTYRAHKGPFVEAIHYTDGDVERIVLEELRAVQLLPLHPEPIRVDRFVEKRFGVAVEPLEMRDGVLGFSEFGPTGVRAVYVAASLDEDRSVPGQRRLRSTIAHEAGHCLLHTHLFALPETLPLFSDNSDPNAPKVLCRDFGSDSGAARPYNGEWWEFQANMAMAHLLLPTPLLREAVTPYLEVVGNLGTIMLSQEQLETAARGLAEVFDVNPVVSRLRLQKLFKVERSGQMML